MSEPTNILTTQATSGLSTGTTQAAVTITTGAPALATHTFTTFHPRNLKTDDVWCHQSIINHERVKTLRMLYSDVILTKATLHVTQSRLLAKDVTALGIIRFGFTPAGIAAPDDAAKLRVIPYLSTLTLSTVSQVQAETSILPPGAELNYGVRATRNGHITSTVINDGYDAVNKNRKVGTPLEGEAQQYEDLGLPLVLAWTDWTMTCSGQGPGVTIDF